jgi:uncharacterized membrane protein
VPFVLHPFATHFPIALLLLNLALTLAYLRRADPFLERSAYGALLIGWWGLFASTLTGTLELALNWPLQPDAVAWINAHAALGLLLLLLLVTGWIGGHLVYGLGFGVDR